MHWTLKCEMSVYICILCTIACPIHQSYLYRAALYTTAEYVWNTWSRHTWNMPHKAVVFAVQPLRKWQTVYIQSPVTSFLLSTSFLLFSCFFSFFLLFFSLYMQVGSQVGSQEVLSVLWRGWAAICTSQFPSEWVASTVCYSIDWHIMYSPQ